MTKNREGVVILPILVIVLLLGTIGVFAYQNFQLKKDQATSTLVMPTPAVTNQLVQILYQGGLCPGGNICSSTTTITRDGSVLVDNITKTSISPPEIDSLSKLIDQTDFDQIRSKKFTDICPTAYDGQEATFTFYTAHGTQVISSCEVQIDLESPLFSKIIQIIT